MYNYPHSGYRFDAGSAFVRSAKMRLFLRLWELACTAAGFVLFLIPLALVMLVAVILKFSEFMFIGLLFVVGILLAIVLRRFRALRRVPLRCSCCSALMERCVESLPSQPGVVFYVCHPCRVYLDSGVTC